MVTPFVNKDIVRHAIQLADVLTSEEVTNRALRSAGLSRGFLDGSPGIVPLALEAKFGEELALATGERHIGCLVGEKFRYTALGCYADYVLSAPELASALERGRHALPLLHPGCSVSLREAGSHIVLEIDTKLQQVIGAKHLQEAMGFLLLDLARHYLGPAWSPDWVEIPAAPVKANTLREELFSSTVRYGADLTGMALRKSVLYARNPNPPDASASLRLTDLPRMMGLAPPQTVTDEVEIILQMQLEERDLSVDGVASKLGLSVRSLQRMLQAEGTNFREVSQQFLKSRAITFMARTDITISEVARLLGYQEPNSFSRAFLEWTGFRPSEFKKLRK